MCQGSGGPEGGGGSKIPGNGAKGISTLGSCMAGGYTQGRLSSGRSRVQPGTGAGAAACRGRSAVLLRIQLACIDSSRLPLGAALQQDRRHGHSTHGGAQQQQAGAVQVSQGLQLAEVRARIHRHRVVGQAAQQRACKPGQWQTKCSAGRQAFKG